tara:strand:+ start:519 stop:824 length:306 start_codon:yes stop_codon:yes gene_type:complete
MPRNPRSKRPRIWGNAVITFLEKQKVYDTDGIKEYKYITVDNILHGAEYNNGKKLRQSKRCPNIQQLSRFLRLNKNVERVSFMQNLNGSTYEKYQYRYKDE